MKPSFKDALVRKFNAWYSDQASDAMTTNCNIGDTQLGLKIPTLKPLHAGWLLHACDFAAWQTDVLKHGWEEPGLLMLLWVSQSRTMSGKNDFKTSDCFIINCNVNRLLMVILMYAYRKTYTYIQYLLLIALVWMFRILWMNIDLYRVNWCMLYRVWSALVWMFELPMWY